MTPNGKYAIRIRSGNSEIKHVSTAKDIKQNHVKQFEVIRTYEDIDLPAFGTFIHFSQQHHL